VTKLAPDEYIDQPDGDEQCQRTLHRGRFRQKRRPARQLDQRPSRQPTERHRVFVGGHPEILPCSLPIPGRHDELNVIVHQNVMDERPKVQNDRGKCREYGEQSYKNDLA
jgi:hypothetical protein